MFVYVLSYKIAYYRWNLYYVLQLKYTVVIDNEMPNLLIYLPPYIQQTVFLWRCVRSYKILPSPIKRCKWDPAFPAYFILSSFGECQWLVIVILWNYWQNSWYLKYITYEIGDWNILYINLVELKKTKCKDSKGEYENHKYD